MAASRTRGELTAACFIENEIAKCRQAGIRGSVFGPGKREHFGRCHAERFPERADQPAGRQFGVHQGRATEGDAQPVDGC
jgi:hypothetical protein